jgi:hypothetical protein
MERPLRSGLFTVGTFTSEQNVSEGLSPEVVFTIIRHVSVHVA